MSQNNLIVKKSLWVYNGLYDKERVLQNMTSIISGLKEIEPDILLLQEVDRSATRSFYVNEFEMIRRKFPEMENSYALNFKLIPIRHT